MVEPSISSKLDRLTELKHHNDSKNKHKYDDKPDLIQEIERIEPKELLEIAADNLENDIIIQKQDFTLTGLGFFLKMIELNSANQTIIPVVFLQGKYTRLRFLIRSGS